MASRHWHWHWRVVRNITNGRMTNSLLLRRSFSNNTSNNKELIKENSVSDDVTNLVSQRIRNEVKDYTRRLKEMNVGAFIFLKYFFIKWIVIKKDI